MAGAFGSGRVGRPQDEGQDGPQDALSNFAAKLSQASGGKERPGILPGGSGPRPSDPMSVRSNDLSAMDRLTAMVKSRTPKTVAQDARIPPRTPSAPKGEFILGEKPRPTGPTAHEVMTHPAHQAVLKDVLADFESQNPGRVLKGPHLMNLWNAKNPGKPLNEARARTVVAKVNKARDSYVQKQVQSLMRGGKKGSP